MARRSTASFHTLSIQGKVGGKLAGTIGIFISMSGYAEDAVDALIIGKGLNVILLGRRDMDAAIVRGSGIKKVLKLKIRTAAEEGVVYYPAEIEFVTTEETSVIDIEHLSFDCVTDRVLATQPVQTTIADLLVVCEGDSDREVIATLVERILMNAGSGRSIKIVTAMGKLTIPRVANALRNTFHSESKVLIVVDGDSDPVGIVSILSNGWNSKTGSIHPESNDRILARPRSRASPMQGRKVPHRAIPASC